MSTQPRVPVIGERAPDFTLPDAYGRSVTLSELCRETAVLLVFVPFAFSGTCGSELSEIRDDPITFRSEHVRTVAVSCDPMFALRAWADEEQYEFPLLSDFWPHGAVASAFGVFDERMGAAVRGTFLIDPEGVIQWSLVHAAGERRDFDAFRQALAVLIGA